MSNKPLNSYPLFTFDRMESPLPQNEQHGMSRFVATHLIIYGLRSLDSGIFRSGSQIEPLVALRHAHFGN
jgi:hypothetical protein